jgi:CBS domain-containing protein
VRGGRAPEVIHSVACPRRGETSVETCQTCSRLEEVSRDGVVCTAGPAPDPMPLHLARKVLSTVADRTPISEIMTRDVMCVGQELEVDTLTAMLLDRGISAAPVVDGDGFPIGLVSKTDLVRDGWENGTTEPGFCVRDVMAPLVYTLRDRQPMATAAAMMALERVHHLPVVDDHGRVVGMLSALDFVRWIAGGQS